MRCGLTPTIGSIAYSRGLASFAASLLLWVVTARRRGRRIQLAAF